MSRPKNEGKACDAVVRWLEEQTGEMRTKVCLPEKCRKGPPVDMRLSLDNQKYALEHTEIEPFSESIRMGISLEKLFTPIKDAVSGQLPGSARFKLLFPYDPRINEKYSKIKQRQNAVIRQILCYAPNLYDEASKFIELGERGCSTRTLNDFPYSLELYCNIQPDRIDVKEPGDFGAVRASPAADELEKMRECRLLKTLKKKCGKLNACADARTVLVLENNDIALTSEVSVRETLQRIFSDYKFDVDVIFLVNTTTKVWYFLCLKCGLDWPEIDPALCTEWNPDNLTNIASLMCCPQHPLSPYP